VLCVFVRSPTSYHYYLGSCGAPDTLWFLLSVSLARMVSGPTRTACCQCVPWLPLLSLIVAAARLPLLPICGCFWSSLAALFGAASGRPLLLLCGRSGSLLLPHFVFVSLGFPCHTLGVAPRLLAPRHNATSVQTSTKR
jgi:hypothetical protein